MKTRDLLFGVWLLTSFNLSAVPPTPGQTFTSRMNHIFAQADKSRITTGLLSDYGLQMVEPGYFNGIPADSNYVDMNTWKMLYTGIYTSRINGNISLTLPDTVFSRINGTTHATAVPLAMMHYQYNRLNENAVSLGLVQVVNEQIIDVPGASTPYQTKQLFAVAPKELLFSGPAASFVFKSNLFYRNVNKTVQQREINFNNESGYITAAWDTPVSYIFTTGGVKSIYFRLTYTDGTSHTSRTNIRVTAATAGLRSSQAGIQDISIPATSQHSGGTMQIKLSTYNNTGMIRKPLIVAEGFDASCIMGNEQNVTINDFVIKKDYGTIKVPYSGNDSLVDRINDSLFDIIYLDYNNGVDNIWRNAQLFKEVIRYVNENRQGNEQNVVMGISMGGLVARIALRQMELAGENHRTCRYISVDSPHKGANVPAGFQAAVRHIENTGFHLFLMNPNTNINVLNYRNFSDAKGAVDLLNSMAAQQMLIYYLRSNYSFYNSVHNTFQQQYDQLGFPQQCQNIAISNGSNNGSLIFAPGSALIDWRESYSFKWWIEVILILLRVSDVLDSVSGAFIFSNYPQVALNIIPGHSEVKVELNVDALKNQSVSRIYKGKVYIRKRVFFVPVNINLEEKTVNSTSDMLPLDGAPGGLYSMDMMGGDLPIPDEGIKQSKFCFVPTVSSLALSDWTAKLTQNLTSATTPFDSVFTQGNNELHTRFNSSAQFLYSQLPFTPTIFGPDLVRYSGSVFTLHSVPPGATVQWSVTGPFTLSGATNTSVTVVKTGNSSDSYSLTASIGGSVVSGKTIRPHPNGISGPSEVCTSGSTFILELPLGTAVQWGITGPFTMSGVSHTSVTVTKTGVGNNSGSLTVYTGTGSAISGKSITSCETKLVGPDIFCSSGGVFSIQNLPVNMPVTWQCSSNLHPVSGSGNNMRFSGNGAGWVRATAGGFQFPQIVTYGGYPAPVTVSIQSMSNGSYTGIASTPAGAKTAEYRWTGLGGWTVTPYPGVPNAPLLHSVTITPPVGYHSERHIIVEAHNVCGMGTVSAFIPEGNRYQSYASAYPNPASGILNIEIDGQAFAQSRESAVDARSVKSDPVFDIRLYDGQGNLLRRKTISGGKTEFNVSSLPAGIYYLHVYDGVSDKPDMRQIVVEK